MVKVGNRKTYDASKSTSNCFVMNCIELADALRGLCFDIFSFSRARNVRQGPPERMPGVSAMRHPAK